MTAQEAVDKFHDLMLNEIFHSSADETLQQQLIASLKEVKKTITDTLDASK